MWSGPFIFFPAVPQLFPHFYIFLNCNNIDVKLGTRRLNCFLLTINIVDKVLPYPSAQSLVVADTRDRTTSRSTTVSTERGTAKTFVAVL